MTGWQRQSTHTELPMQADLASLVMFHYCSHVAATTGSSSTLGGGTSAGRHAIV